MSCSSCGLVYRGGARKTHRISRRSMKHPVRIHGKKQRTMKKRKTH